MPTRRTQRKKVKPRRMSIAVVGNYIPRQCGLATFTTDLATWVSRSLPQGSDVFVVAMDDREGGYNYPDPVRFEVLAGNPRDYPRAADFVNLSGVDLVCLQHEFGIFGGPRGIYVTGLLRELRKPVVTTAHTVLPDPEPERREAMVKVAELSDAVVVMSRKCVDILEEHYGVPREKVFLIHHGVPDMPLESPDVHKGRWGLKGKTVLLTFGLLHPGKGIEYMIEAMPRIVEAYNDVVYVVLGATHPPVKAREGEKYRFYLMGRARELGVSANVEFYDRFVSFEELVSFLASCDVYVTPYLERNQVVSGTLAYALGLGKPVVSTPYFYAEEMLGGERGVLVPFRDSDALAGAVLGLLSDPERMKRIREKAYGLGRRMVWKEVAREYVELFGRVLAGRELETVPREMPRKPVSLRDLPRPRLDYLARLTDSIGVIHKSHFDIPDRTSGYTADDNALALAAAVLSHLQTGDERSLELARIYVGFLDYMQRPDGRFRYRMGYDKSVSDEPGGEESQGKSLAGLGIAVALESDEGLASLAKMMFDRAIEGLELRYPRALAYAIIGCYHYLTRLSGARRVINFLECSAEGLLDAYSKESAPDWRWFEDSLTYANGTIPRALLLAYRETGEDRCREVALESLEFLTGACYRDGVFNLVGNEGWYPRGGSPARFKQSPIEATSLCEAYVDAYVIERDARYLELARCAFEWFLGRNINGMPLYDFASFSCADGLLLNEVDPNRSAEAIIHWLLALLRIQTVLHLEPAEKATGP